MTTTRTMAAPGGADHARKRGQLARLLSARALGYRAHPYTRAVNGDVADLLHGLGLDVAFSRGHGTELFDADGRRYLDFAGAYGALPFGHNPPAVWQAINDLHASAEPSLVQPSLLDAAGALAQALLAVAPTGMSNVWFCNSGAEAVEASIKLARSATRRGLVLSTVDAFHGKTLGALSATGRARYQTPFGAPAGGFAHVPFGDVHALRAFFAEHGSAVAAFIVEPIQGEAGIRPAPAGYLQAARDACTDAGALLVIDEVQTGLGRTGQMFAVEHEAIVPDIMPLAKALGGGLVPIGAVVYNGKAHSEDFALRHTSTFGGNSFCARVGLRALELLTENDQRLVKDAAARGEQLACGLRELQDAYPELVTDVRGRGLLLGLELSNRPQDYPRQGLFRSLAAQEGLAAFLCGHLLRVEGLRLAPTYFSGTALRVEPPLTVSAGECDEFLAALRRGLHLIADGNSADFFAHLAPAAADEGGFSAPARPAPAPVDGPRPGEPRWAFLVHPTDDVSYESFDAALEMPGTRVRRLFDRMSLCRNIDGPAAMHMGSCRLHTDTGETSHGVMYALPRRARELLDMPSREAVDLVQRAVDEAVADGAQVVGLGAYTSIVSRNAEALRDPGVPVTTGNAFTAAAAADGIRTAGTARDIDLPTAVCTVLGAGGSIGRATTLLLSEDVGSLILVGNPAHPERSLRVLAEVAHAVVQHLCGRSQRTVGGMLAQRVTELCAEGCSVFDITRTLREDGLTATTVDSGPSVRAADVLVAATSTPDQLITADMPRPGAVICDVSQPPNVDPGLRAQRPDLLVIDGGLVRLPQGRDLGIDLGVPRGVTYACAAETMIIAHRLQDPVVSRGGHLDVSLVRTLRDAGPELGFALHVPVAAPVPRHV